MKHTSGLVALGLLAAVTGWSQVPPDPGSFYAPDKFALDDLPRYVPEQKVTGTIRLWGSGYIAAGKTLQFWEEGFRRFHPAADFAAHLGDSLTAIPALYTGAAHLGSGPRISWNDLKAFNHTLGHDPLAIMAMTGSFNVPGWNAAFAIIVHRDNPLAGVTMKQLDGIFGEARDGGWRGIEWHPELARGPEGNLRMWGQLGLTGEWAGRPIHVYGANPRYGISQTLSDALLTGSDRWNESMRTFTNRPRGPGDPPGADATLLAVQQIAEAVAQDPGGIGFTSIAYVDDRTRALPLATRAGEPGIALTIENVRNRRYPLADESYLYADRAPDRPLDPKVREFLRYILSREGQEAVARDGKYLPLTAAAAREQLKKLD
jgi:phosphate transport system substrate-binding protein